MATLERTTERRHYIPAARKISWSAILSGAAVGIAMLVIFGVLGLAVGATTIDPGPGDSPSAKALTVGAGIWWLISGVLALFAGSWIAARLAGVRRQLEGPLHGVVTWATTSIVTTALMVTVTGMLISGAFRIVGSTASLAGSGVKTVVQEVITANPSSPDIAWDQVWQEAQLILEQTKSESLQPENLQEALDSAASDLRKADLEAALSRLARRARVLVSAADRQAAINVLRARTDMTEEEARTTVDRWAETLEGAWRTTADVSSQTLEGVERAAVTTTRKTVSAVSVAAWWTFFYLILTMAAAVVGGYLGAPRWRLTPSGPDTTGRSVDAGARETTAES